jgi:hypothetical protein
MTVTKFSRGRAFADNDVGAEYLSKNSLIPFLTFSVENIASPLSLPGAKNTTV